MGLWFVFYAFACLISFAAHRGHVTREEMMEFGRFMNSKFDEEKLNKLMDQMDLDKDGLISMEEFLGYFAKVGPRTLSPLLGVALGFVTPRHAERRPVSARLQSSDGSVCVFVRKARVRRVTRSIATKSSLREGPRSHPLPLSHRPLVCASSCSALEANRGRVVHQGHPAVPQVRKGRRRQEERKE